MTNGVHPPIYVPKAPPKPWSRPIGGSPPASSRSSRADPEWRAAALRASTKWHTNATAVAGVISATPPAAPLWPLLVRLRLAGMVGTCAVFPESLSTQSLTRKTIFKPLSEKVNRVHFSAPAEMAAVTEDTFALMRPLSRDGSRTVAAWGTPTGVPSIVGGPVCVTGAADANGRC